MTPAGKIRFLPHNAAAAGELQGHADRGLSHAILVIDGYAEFESSLRVAHRANQGQQRNQH
jgi:hypothetical protein